jgi:hypothetical protein
MSEGRQMDREQRAETGHPKPAPPRHLDLAWSSPAPPWRADPPLAVPDGATVPASAWAEPWPRVVPDPEPENAVPEGNPTGAGTPGRHLDLAWSSPVEPKIESPVAPAEQTTSASQDTGPPLPPGVAPASPQPAPEASTATTLFETAPTETASTAPPPTEGFYAEPDFADLAEFDELSFPKARVPRSTWFLATALLLVLAFGGGILTQKHHDVGLVDPKAAALEQLKESAAGGAAAGPALTGTITAVSPTQFTVRDAKGAEHKVAVTDQTPIVKKLAPPGLSSGSQVVVQGTNDADGTLHATAVVEP